MLELGERVPGLALALRIERVTGINPRDWPTVARKQYKRKAA
jgi:hypothetical protein